MANSYKNYDKNTKENKKLFYTTYYWKTVFEIVLDSQMPVCQETVTSFCFIVPVYFALLYAH